jgi:phasin family protein
MSDAPTLSPKTETFPRKSDRVVDALKQSTEKVAETAAQTMHAVQDQARGGIQKMSEAARVYADAQRETLETVAHATRIYGEGLQGLGKHAAEVTRLQIEDGVAHLRALSGVKSVTDLFHLQAEFARKTASRAMAETSTLVEDYLKVAGEALAPVTAKVREAAEKVKQAA